MRTLFIATLLAASTAASALHAQDEGAADLRPGARVRVTVPVTTGGRIITATRGWTVGTVQSVDREFIVLRVQRPEGQTEEQIPFDVISGLEVSRGIGSERDAQMRGLRRGALIGIGIGAGVSALTYLYDRSEGEDLDGYDDCTGACSVLEGSAVNTVRNVAVAGGLGALAGMLIGGRAREIWEPTAKPRLDLRSRNGGGTAVSLTFAL